MRLKRHNPSNLLKSSGAKRKASGSAPQSVLRANGRRKSHVSKTGSKQRRCGR